jgi:hypothetical protein
MIGGDCRCFDGMMSLAFDDRAKQGRTIGARDGVVRGRLFPLARWIRTGDDRQSNSRKPVLPASF